MSKTDNIDRYFYNRQKEIDGAALYFSIAEVVKQPHMSDVYRKLAATEEKHAKAWEKKLTALNVLLPPSKISWRTKIMIWLLQRFGPQYVLPIIANNERTDSQAYDSQFERKAELFSTDEKPHARLLTMAAQSTGGRSGGTVAQLESCHRASGGNALRAAVLGANDGLVSILSLTMGVGGATNSNVDVLIAG
jgi:hypothetical protein